SSTIVCRSESMRVRSASAFSTPTRSTRSRVSVSRPAQSRVEAVGRSVQGLEPGDAVFGRSSTGTLAEYTRAPADNFAPKPVNLSMEQAAAIPVSAFTALQALREIARVQPG